MLRRRIMKSAANLMGDRYEVDDLTPSMFERHENNCGVKLYEDAKGYNHCWNDVSDDMEAARQFIYITGWSVDTSTKLRRKPPKPTGTPATSTPTSSTSTSTSTSASTTTASSATAETEDLTNSFAQLLRTSSIGASLRTSSVGVDTGGETIGELLKRKAGQGVRVLIHVWDEKTSGKLGLIQGIAKTHDEETRMYFERTPVAVCLSYRHDAAKASGATFLFSHHQKTIIMDAPPKGPGQRPRIIAYVGGLDLTTGRYDTPHHHLFSTIDTRHQNDFYHTWGLHRTVGPRQPWHDIHMRVHGPIAWDVLQNFEQRWKKQSNRPDCLLRLDRASYDLTADPAAGTWTCTLLRSIDKFSAEGVEDVESGIQLAYVDVIRSAREFLYIENQYFLGSAHNWVLPNAVPCCNHIPWEITKRIISSIETRRPFRVFVVIPLFPEGNPETAALQEILHWEYKTMHMMYHNIAKALHEAKKQKQKHGGPDIPWHPRDYLNFFCLGNREKMPADRIPPGTTLPDMHLRLVQSQRFMIYVHSKMMIADDNAIIIGSANINERSMNGARDTEIAVLASPSNAASAQDIQKLRLALWKEHTGVVQPEFERPNNPQAIATLREIGKQNWKVYSAPTFAPMTSHLMNYPMEIDEDGDISYPLKHFPDTTALICGASSTTMPDMLTT
ncbi:Phospholipase D gamma 1 [Pelomyxa schiedti]|nr:Phospholipase D gamma 1 [Pelomyxa schiedti]